MTAIDAVQHPHRPRLLEQLPSCSCKITKDGTTYCLGGVSCTAYAGAMFVDSTTGGRYQPSGCAIRRMTGDVVGGTMLTQVAKVIRDEWGIAVSVYTGTNVVTPAYLARQIRAGRRAIVQGNTQAYEGTKYNVTAGDVNHAETWIEVRGGTLDEPLEVLVYDSCADGRRAGIDQGPTWIAWTIAKRFAACLRPAGVGTARLGPGKVYCAIGPDTEPHVTLLGKTATHSAGRQAQPFPDRVRAALDRTPVHNAPRRGKATTTRYIPKGRLVRFYQYVEGESYKGDATWGANDDGTEFIHFANVTHEGGGT